MPLSGTLLRIHLFPVKSMDGAPVDEVRVEPAGLVGDRGWAVVDTTGRPLRTKDHPALATCLARATPTGPELLLPGAGSPVPAAAAGPHLAALLGTGPLDVRPQPGGARQVAAVHVVALADLGTAPGGTRANLLLDLPGGTAGRAGSRLRIGDVELHLDAPPRHCAGVHASVLRPGTVRTGDDVVLLEAPPAAAAGRTRRERG
ncbi:hypothetical protein NUM3379_05570 [Kineococcus sp. NUM-3379]